MPQDTASGFAIAASDAVKVEDPRGVTPFTFVVTRTGDTSAAAVLSYAVTGSGPNPALPADFAGGSLPAGTVAFPAGAGSETITVEVQGNPAARPDLGFNVRLSGPAGVVITTPSADGTIRTSDADTTVSAFAAGIASLSHFNFGAAVAGAIVAALGKLTGGPSGTVARSGAPTGPFRPPVAGVANAAVAGAPAGGSLLSLPAGYDALVAGGTAAVTLSDAGAASCVLAGNAVGDTFSSTGSGSVLIGGAGNDIFEVLGSAQIYTGSGQDTVLAGGEASISIIAEGALTAILAGGASSVTSFGGATVFGGAGAVTFNPAIGALTAVGGDGHLTFRGGLAACTVFGGKGGVDFLPGDSFNIVVGGAGAINVQTGGSGAYWGNSGQDVIRGGDGYTVMFGVGGDKLYAQGGGVATLVAEGGDVLMDGSASSGSNTFFGGSSGMDTMLAGSGTTLIGTGTGASTVQLGGGKATVFAFGSGPITSGTGSADIVFEDRTQFHLDAVGAGSTRVFALFNFVPGAEHIILERYGSNAAAFALAGQTNAGGYTTLTMPDQTTILLLGIAHADIGVFA